ncbi:hypothetical protein HAX54_040717 [Datura stramonium]|uniref:Peptidase S8/S53 domain-containing protein n=1 Tax=Datura stramonium TaxID=4076 RepID=A0ABS8VN37_DATST|nr:hypothetical protein [Datura stramonium]
MACPYVSGIATLLHSAHPKWTSAAIRSALLTTTDTADHLGKPIMNGDAPAKLFAAAARHKFSEVFSITHRKVSCHDILQKNRAGITRKMIKRGVINVGNPNSIYSVDVVAPEGVKVRVKPRRLIFKHANQSISYKVWFISRKRIGSQRMSFAEGQLRSRKQSKESQDSYFSHMDIKEVKAITTVTTVAPNIHCLSSKLPIRNFTSHYKLMLEQIRLRGMQKYTSSFHKEELTDIYLNAMCFTK